ncbi:hypothetical protein Tsubulata_023793 [Turnera subulata]|uniref:Uncharacterized protein n=1 Tax=Turnera subulata TaxID=218843 RepID=A0A9Q0G5K7_9ROSI|nr:hypothetical protein Tsubulata_023793 [Turnera subulata]
MMQDETRKGPWTEQEDVLLVNFVHLFGDRRWDFIAKVSGLKVAGTRNRLRWVNYLHPGLKRGKMTPQEERLVLELHAKWGNSFYDTGGPKQVSSAEGKSNETLIRGSENGGGYSMDDIWKDIENSIDQPAGDGFSSQEGGGNFSFSMPSPSWNYCPDTLWSLDDEEESKMFLPYEGGTLFLTG